jgi:hypothetical protein
MVALVLQQHHIAGLRISEYRAHLCAVHPIVTVEYARLGRYDESCHNARYHTANTAACQVFQNPPNAHFSPVFSPFSTFFSFSSAGNQKNASVRP